MNAIPKIKRKYPWKIAFVLIGLIVLYVYFGFRPDAGISPEIVQQTRNNLRKQGFKLDLAEFNFSTSPELRNRAAIITNLTSHFRYDWRDLPELLEPVGKNAAYVTWNRRRLLTTSEKDWWPRFREEYAKLYAALALARQTVLSGEVRFEPLMNGGNPMVPYVAEVQSFCNILTAGVLLELRDGHQTAAWTNLWALTRMVTAWNPDPMHTAHSVRFKCAKLAEKATWELLQSKSLSDAQLTTLQHEWESLDYFSDLPQNHALSRACMMARCQMDRQQPPPRLSVVQLLSEFVSDFFRSPRGAVLTLKLYWERQAYYPSGSFMDENDLMLYFRDRELEVKKAVQSSSWTEMRQLPGVTNNVPFQSKWRVSGVGTLMIMKHTTLGFVERGLTLLAQASEAETRRRMIIIALALERYRLLNGTYPMTLNQLVPVFIKSIPMDFMDNQPLRYSLPTKASFVLYSIGLDGVDNHGQMTEVERLYLPITRGVQMGTDIVWPRPATQADIEAQNH